RHFECETAEGAPPLARITEGIVHPALPDGGFAFGIRNAHGAFESGGAIAAFVTLDFEIEQLERDRQRNLFPAISDLHFGCPARHGDLPAGRHPLFGTLASLLDSNPDSVW